MTNTKEHGEAYAFFDCNASKQQIADELSIMRQRAQAPTELELSLVEHPDENLMKVIENAWKGNSFGRKYDGLAAAIKEGSNLEVNVRRFNRLADVIHFVRGRPPRYAMVARHAEATNRKTADELGDVLSAAYMSPLFIKDERFGGEIFYEQDGEYIFRE